MKFFVFPIVAFLVIGPASAQMSGRDSLWQQLSNTTDNIARVNILLELGDINANDLSADTAFYIAQESLKLSEASGYEKGKMYSKRWLAHAFWMEGDFATSIKLAYSILPYVETNSETDLTWGVYSILAMSHRDQGDYREGLVWMKRAYKMLASISNCDYCAALNGFFGSCYYGLGQYDSSLVYLNKALSYPPGWGFGWICLIMGRTQEKLNNTAVAFAFYHQSIDDLSQSRNSKDLAGAYSSIAGLFNKTGKIDSALYYGKKALLFAQEKKYHAEMLDAYMILSSIYEKISTAEALQYYKLAMDARNNLYALDKQRQITSFKFNEQLRQTEIRSAEVRYRSRIRIYIFSGIIAFFLVVLMILIRNNRQKQKARVQIEKAYSDLKSTQAQLIHSEKMASLGELTAGIAHEIQNPLNFVNNFSDVNQELLGELNDEIDKGNLAEVKAIANNLIENEQKINHHGKRADSIVKGMLQHSRTSAGQKERTDINKLADEYLRLSYHGLRAKDKSFNAEFKTDFDDSVGKINVISQDIGRVLLNLFNNAFYAVNEKLRAQSSQLTADYKPLVSVQTKKINNEVQIRVSDNGNGIPRKVLDKIFQPFFTTKPTGQGTGLGLSLAYDIVKAHGGELRVETIEGEGSVFNIQLPIN